MEDILTDGQYFHQAPVNVVMLQNFDGLKFDFVSGNCQKH